MTAPPSLAQQLTRLLTDDLQAYEDSDPHAPGIGPSDSDRCRRQVGYRVTETPMDRPEDATLVRMAWIGTALHDHVARARQHSHPTWLVEGKVQPPGLDRPGTVDAYLDDLGNVDDIKTKTGRGYEAILTRGRAYDGDRKQSNVYALALEDAGHVVKTCSVTYVDREGRHDPFVDCWTYDREEALAALAALHALADAIDAGADLPRDGRGPDTGRPCDTCPWIATCWELDSLPEGYTAQSAYLAPTEVADAAETLRKLREEKRAITEAEDYLKLQLQGHSGATFTDEDGVQRQVKWSRGSRTGGQLDSKAVRARYADLDEEPPTLGTGPRVTTPAVP